MNLTELMRQVIVAEAPDLHLQVNRPPTIRLRNGNLDSLTSFGALTEEDVRAVINEITNDKQKARFEADHELDFSYHIGNLSRFRVNVYEERNGPAVAFRVITEKIPSLESLGLTEVAQRFAELPHGLVLVTGTTGMGKSTTLASIIDTINATRDVHVITIEDPIEFVYEQKRALISQREVNVHTHSFPNAIRAALRQDPDVVLVGEMRDLETIAAAITLAETGHLVFSTLHTTDAAQTVDRIIDVFPSYQQQQIRSQLSSSLMGVVSQVLVPRADGQGRIAAREIMFANDAIRNCISKGETHQIYSIMQINRGEGMILMDQALMDLYSQGIITAEEAMGNSDDPETMQSMIVTNQ